MLLHTPDVERENPRDVASDAALRVTPLGEYLAAKVAHGFDYTTTRMALDAERTAQAEIREYAGDDPWTAQLVHRAVPAAPVEWGMGPEAARRAGADRLTDSAWRRSEWYRPGIEYTPGMNRVRARILAEDYDKRRARDASIAGSPTGWRSVLGFGAELLGQLPDPLNFIPLGVSAKGASLGARALHGALESAGGALLADALVLPDLVARGEDVGWMDAAGDMLFGGLIGGGVGWLGGALARRRALRQLRSETPMPERGTAGRALGKAVEDLADGRPVDVGPVLRTPEGARLLAETAQVGRLYDDALFAPLNPSANNEAVLRSAVAEALDPQWAEIVVDKGAGRIAKGKVARELDYGLVKIIYEHGEGAAGPKSKAVTRRDMMDFPRVVREFMPVERTVKRDGANWTWVVRGENGHKVIHVARLFSGTDGRPHLVTSHVANEGSPYPYSKKLWPKEKAALLASRETSREGLADTISGASTRPHGDVLSRGASGTAEKNIDPPTRKVNPDAFWFKRWAGSILDLSARSEAEVRGSVADILEPLDILEGGEVEVNGRQLRYGGVVRGRSYPAAARDVAQLVSIMREYQPSDTVVADDFGFAEWAWVMPGGDDHVVVHMVRLLPSEDRIFVSNSIKKTAPFPFANRNVAAERKIDWGTGEAPEVGGRAAGPGGKGTGESGAGPNVGADAEADAGSAVLDEHRMAEVDELEARGELREDEAEELRAARDAEARSERFEDAGLSIVECVLKEMD